MKKQNLQAAISVVLISLGMASSADAALIGRLAATSGGTDYQAYYDDEAQLTWLADANAAQTSGYAGTGVLSDGRMTWQAANDWAAQLTVGGVSGWRLADSDEACFGSNCIDSEMGDLFNNALGNTGASLTSTGPFSNVQSNFYWSATEYAPSTSNAWGFYMSTGTQSAGGKSSSSYGWAVQSGDVSAVPVPAAVWLFGSGLLGLVGVARRKKV